jgi:hypothetical protein
VSERPAERRARDGHGRLSGFYLALKNEPRAMLTWDAGRGREPALGKFLAQAHNGRSLIVLHDRRIPGTRTRAEHVAIAPTGLYVIGAKSYAGRVRRIDKGAWVAADRRLYVGRRDCTKLVRGAGKQAGAIRNALGEPLIEEFELEIRAALCFSGSDWSLFARPLEIRGVWVGWVNALGKLLRAPGPLEPGHVRSIAERVARALPAA